MVTDQRPHKNLDVWKCGMQLVVKVYKATSSFPRSEEFGLSSQQRRAAVSIPSNIAEGLARRTEKEKLQFLSICQGSLSELDTQIEISMMLGYVDDNTYREIAADILKVQKLLSGLMRSIRG
jgi:four helix bundle protein